MAGCNTCGSDTGCGCGTNALHGKAPCPSSCPTFYFTGAETTIDDVTKICPIGDEFCFAQNATTLCFWTRVGTRNWVGPVCPPEKTCVGEALEATPETTFPGCDGKQYKLPAPPDVPASDCDADAIESMACDTKFQVCDAEGAKVVSFTTLKSLFDLPNQKPLERQVQVWIAHFKEKVTSFEPQNISFNIHDDWGIPKCFNAVKMHINSRSCIRCEDVSPEFGSYLYLGGYAGSSVDPTSGIPVQFWARSNPSLCASPNRDWFDEDHDTTIVTADKDGNIFLGAQWVAGEPVDWPISEENFNQERQVRFYLAGAARTIPYDDTELTEESCKCLE